MSCGVPHLRFGFGYGYVSVSVKRVRLCSTRADLKSALVVGDDW